MCHQPTLATCLHETDLNLVQLEQCLEIIWFQVRDFCTLCVVQIKLDIIWLHETVPSIQSASEASHVYQTTFERSEPLIDKRGCSPPPRSGLAQRA